MNFPTAADHDPLIAEVLVGEEELRGRVVELGAEISRDYAGLDPVLVGVLKGAVFFIADLVRTMTVPARSTSWPSRATATPPTRRASSGS
jgi:hypoxanthine-guanine phosphoribosyltransferase